MSIFTNKKILSFATIVVLAVSMLGQAQAMNSRRYVTPLTFERGLEKNATNGTTTTTSAADSLWTRSSAVGVTVFMGVAGFFLF